MNNDSKHPKLDELMSLTAKFCDSTINSEESRRLNQLLRDHSELRKHYLDYTGLNAELLWRYRTGSNTTSPELTSEGLPDETIDDEQSQVHHHRDEQELTPTDARSISINSPYQVLAAVAILCLVAVLGVFLSSLFNNGTSSTQDDSQSKQLDSQSSTDREPAPEFVATLLDANAPVWSQSGTAIEIGSRVQLGEVKLDSGEAEFVFDSGAVLALSGPARLELQSASSAFLGSGALVAQMPISAIGFRLRTESADLIDQGTEFGVVCEPDGSTEVHVFRGSVDVVRPKDPLPYELVDGHAMRIDDAGANSNSIPFSKERFGVLARRLTTPIQWPIEQGGNDHFYQLVTSESPITWHQAAQESMRLYHRGMPGHLITITSAEEDRFVVDQVIGASLARGIWIGLTDSLRESHFQWVTGEPFDYSNWASFPAQQPDNNREAPWHGGEDYGMYTAFPEKQPWAWNDLSNDSIHERITSYLVEFEPPVDTVRQRRISMEPIEWSESLGGNGHHYRLVLSLEPTSWQQVADIASQTTFNGIAGHLVAIESDAEMEFVVDKLLRICGIPEVMIGLSSTGNTELKWITGKELGDVEVGRPYLPSDELYGLLRWNNIDGRWEIQSRAIDVRSGSWFGYLIEYPTR